MEENNEINSTQKNVFGISLIMVIFLFFLGKIFLVGT